MTLQEFFLLLHIGGAIILFGPTFAFPFVGKIAQSGGDVKTALRINEIVVRKLVVPGDVVMLATGIALILNGKGLWNPFERDNAWLLLAIVLYVAMLGLAHGVQMGTMKKGLAMAEAGEFGPEFGAVMKKMAKFGSILGAITVVIIILMVVKPGWPGQHF